MPLQMIYEIKAQNARVRFIVAVADVSQLRMQKALRECRNAFEL